MAPSSSLQIPYVDSTAGPSRQQQYSSNTTSRPVSVSAHPTPPSSPPVSSRKQRASHQVVSSTNNQSSQNSQHGGHGQEDATPPYTDVYSHPAAVAYAAAHPKRTIPKFGPYLLLQTLGEGEFGKVKLGLHSQWGEEVAVKLIRRGNVDNTVRMSKVEREIEVLRTLKHPNIVRLYDVIETDKYIGIIIEYASGGELFDHILAHRYLRERDAAKLFSQLISGVWYIHQKKIVHRDLKLENLLLDRHRNVIITDFGFANRFEHRADDLMQTSCGSPCYAAPELVISEGLYVGSAVDIWSCGVILYAMLAGYLPFDDDPANPDGDNINLLYKYIVNTPLSFPEYVSDSARDLLKMMLVPDPSRRASLGSVMRHPWLATYVVPPTDPTSSAPTAFGRTVEELERAALEQHQQKRLAYQRTMKAAIVDPNARVVRSNSHRPDAGYVNGAGMAVSATNPPQRSRQPEYLYETSHMVVDQAPPASAPVSGGSKRGVYVDEDDPFAAPGSVSSPHIEVPVSPDKGGKKSGRHTIQVEYDSIGASGSVGRSSKRDRENASGSGREKRQRDRSASRGPASEQQQQQHSTPPVTQSPVTTNGTASGRRRASQGSVTKPLPPSPADQRTPVKSSPKVSDRQAPPSITLASPPDTPLASAHPDAHEVGERGSQSSSKENGKHKRGLSAVSGLSKIFGTNGDVNGAPAPSPTTPNASGSLLSPDMEKEKEAPGSASKKSRRNTLTVMVGTIKSKTKGRSGTTPTPTPGPETVVEGKKLSPVTPYGKEEDVPPGRERLQASTRQARGVMQWFRSRSKGRDSMGVVGASAGDHSATAEHPPSTPYRKKNATSSSTVNQLSATTQNALLTPAPVSASSRVPPSASKVQRTPSSATDASSVTPSFVKRFRDSVTVGGSSRDHSHSSRGVASAGGVLSVHHGAVDQSMITTRPPPDVMKHIKELLLDIGIEVQIEGEFKYRCIRAKRRKGAGGTSGLGSVGGGGLTAITMVGSAASNGVDRRGLPLPSHSLSGTGGMLRGLLMRRQSSQMSSSLGNSSFIDDDTPNSSVVTSEPGHEPLYGDPPEDVGDEVRFSVELTRIHRLNETYSLDIRRLKGNLRSYKFLYDNIRQRVDLR